MKKFINNPENLTSELLEGLVLSNADLITCEQGNLIVNKKLAEADRVTIVTLGGTGKDKGKRHPTLGNNVMVGSGAKVLGPIRIGDNARIAANAVVLRDVPENSTVVGVPGRIVRIGGEKTDHIHTPDPVALELQALRQRVEALEKTLEEMNHVSL